MWLARKAGQCGGAMSCFYLIVMLVIVKVVRMDRSFLPQAPVEHL